MTTRATMHKPGITARTTTRVKLVQASDIVTTIPDGADGTPSNRWIDLRRNPDQIDLMDELRGRPTLHEQVAMLNLPAGPFMTIACEAATTRLFQHGGSPAWRTSSSLQLVFADLLARCDLDNYVPLARALLDGLGGDPNATRWSRLVELRPNPVVSPSAGRLAWSLTIRTSAYGLDSGTSAHEWNLCVMIQTALIRSWTRLQDLDGMEFNSVSRASVGLRPAVAKMRSRARSGK